MSGIAKFTSVTLAILLAGAAYFVFQTRGDTTIGLTLTTNPNLERGLVGHWTFDGPDMDWGSSTAEVRDRSGNNIHGVVLSTASTSPSHGVIGQAITSTGEQGAHVELDTLDELNPNLNLPGELSAFVWINSNDVDAAQYGNDPLGQCNVSGTVGQFHMDIGRTDGEMTVSWNWDGIVGFKASTTGANFQEGEWYHVGYTRSGSAGDWTARLYVDGELNKEVTGITTDPGPQEASSLLNCYRSTSIAWDGLLDDVRLYDRPLSDIEISRLYGLGGTTHIAETITTNPTLKTGLVGHWTFDGPDIDSGTTVVYDRSSYVVSTCDDDDNTGISTSTTIGVIGQALHFDGTHQFRCPFTDTSHINMGTTGDLSVSFWVRTTATVNQTIVWKNNADGFRVQVSGTGYLKSTISDGVTDVNATGDGEIVNDGEWHLVTVIFDRSANMVRYVDGVQTGTEDNITSVTGDVGGNSNLTFSTYTSPLDGDLDDVRIYDRALSAEEISRLYDLGGTTHIAETITTNPDLERGLVGHWTFDGPDVDWSSTAAEIKDRSGNNNQGDAVNLSARSATVGRIGQALTFATTTFVSIPDSTSLNMGTSDITMAAWVQTSNTTYSQYVFEKYVLDVGYIMRIQPTTGYIAGWIGDGTNTRGYLAGTTVVNDGVWHHVAVRFTRGTTDLVEFYVDGVLESTSHDISIVTGAVDNAGTSLLGKFSSNHFDGSMDDVRIYNRALSASEVKRLYELGS